MSIRFNRKNFLVLAVVGACGVAAGAAKAAVVDWKGTTSSDWSVAGNWSTAPVNDTVSSIAQFGSVAFTNQPNVTVTGTTGTLINGILDQGTTPANVVISGNASTILSVGSAGIVMNAGAGNLTISVPTLNLYAFPTSSQPISTSTGSIVNASSSGLLISSAWGSAAVAVDIQNTGSGDIATTKVNTTGILGPSIVWGTGQSTEFATRTTTVGIVGGFKIGGLTTNPNANYLLVSNPNLMTSPTINYDLSSVATPLSGPVSANTIRYTGTGGTMSIPDGSTVTSAGYLNAGGGTLVIDKAATTGYVTLSANFTAYSASGDIEFKAPIKNTTTTGRNIILGGPNKLLINALETTAAGGITINGANTQGNFVGGVVYIGSSGTLSLKTGTTGGITLAAAIADNPTFNGGTGSSISISSTGTGAVTLAGANTFSGGVTVNTGAFLSVDPFAGSNLALGTGPLNLMSGSFITGGNSFTNGNNNVTNIYGSFATFGATGTNNGQITMGSGTVTLYNSASITIGRAASGTNSREISFGGSVVADGNANYGLTILSDTGTTGGFVGLNGSNNTFTGPLTIGVTGALTSLGGAQVSTFTDRSQVGIQMNTSAVISGLATTDGLVVGQSVSGTGIQTGSRIASIDSATQITLTLPATVSATTNTIYVGMATNSSALSGGVNGNLSLGGTSNSSWASNIVLNPSGTLNIGTAGALGAGTLAVNGGTIVGAAVINTSVNYLFNKNFTLGPSANALNFGTGPVTLGQSIAIINARTGTAVFGGPIGDGSNGYGLTMQLATGLTSGGITFSGPVNIGGPVTISGATASNGMVVTLSNAANGYTGNTVITSGGTLKLTTLVGNSNNIAFSPKILVGPSLADSTALLDVSGVVGATSTGFHVVSGQTLAGYGNILGKITVDSGGHLAPGNSIGTLTVANFVTLSGSSDFEINDNTTTSDVLAGSTKLTYGGDLNVTDLGNTTGYSNGQTFTLFTLGTLGTESGTFANINLPTLPIGLTWETFGSQQFDYVHGQIVVQAAPVPEPASLMLLGLGGLGLLARGRRRLA